jgi:hypothetical protein
MHTLYSYVGIADLRPLLIHSDGGLRNLTRNVEAQRVHFALVFFLVSIQEIFFLPPAL